MATRQRRWVQRQCPYCPATFEAPERAKVQPYDNCRSPECEPKGEADYQAAVAAWQNDPERQARREERRQARRQPQALHGDLAWIARINGIKTDGTGRRARRA